MTAAFFWRETSERCSAIDQSDASIYGSSIVGVSGLLTHFNESHFFIYFFLAPRTCEGLTLDLAIVFDVSYRLGEQHFRFAKEFIDKLLRLYDVSPSGTRVSLVVFTGVAHSVISFHQEDYQNRDALEFVLNYLTPSFSMGKRLDRALEYVNDNVFSLARGDRPDVNNSAVFITDGKIINGNEDISGVVTALRVRTIFN